MLSNLQHTLHLLEQLQQSSAVKQAEREIDGLSSDPLFIRTLEIIIRNPSIQESTTLTAAIYMNRLILEQYSHLEENFVMQVLIGICFDGKVPAKLKCALEKCVALMLEWSHDQYLEKFADDIRSLLNYLYSKEAIEEMQENNHNICLPIIENKKDWLQVVKTLCFLVKCLIETDSATTEPLFRVVRDLHRKTIQLVPMETSEQYLSAHSELFKMWTAIFNHLQQSSDPDKIVLLSQLMKDNQLQKYVLRVYCCGCQEEPSSLIELERMHSMQNMQKIMKTKYYASLLHQLIVAEAIRSRAAAVLQGLYEQVNLMLRTLAFYALHRQLYDDNCQDFILELLGVFIRCFQGPQKQEFLSQYEVIFRMIIFPLLIADEQERSMFQEQGEDFIVLGEDCCDHQSFGVLKTQASRLLELIGDQNKMASRYAIQLCITSIKAALFKVEKQPHHLPLQTCFLVLSIFSYQLGKHPDVVVELRQVMEYPQLLIQSAFDLSRIYLFLAYNYIEVFSCPTDGEKWIELALQNGQHPTTEMSAMDFVANVAEEHFSEQFLLRVAERIPLTQAKSSKSSILLTTSKLIGSHLTKMKEESLIEVVDHLFLRIDLELQLYLNKIKSNTMDIATCLGIMKKILQKKQYLSHMIRLLNKLWQIIQEFQRMAAINLDDQVMRIVNLFMNFESVLISEEYYEMIPTFIDYFQRPGSGHHTAYFLVFNQFIMKGSFDKIKEKGLLSCLIATFTQLTSGYISANSRVVSEKIALAHSLLLFQNLMAVSLEEESKKKYVIEPQLVSLIYVIALKLIPSSDEPQMIVDRCLIARALNLMLLCHMYLPDQRTLRTLLMFYGQKIFKGYDSKVLVLCLSNQLFREKDPTTIAELLHIMATVIWDQGNNGQSETKQSVNPNKSKFSTKIRIKKVENYEQVLKFMETPFRQTAELEEELRDVLKRMKCNNKHLFSAIIDVLPAEIRDKITAVAIRTIVDGKPRIIVHTDGVKNESKCPIEIKQAQKRLPSVLNSNEDLDEEQQYKKIYLMKKKKRKEQI